MINKARIEDKIYDVVDYTTFVADKDKYDQSYTAVLEQGTIYPVRKKTDIRPGIYPQGPVSFFIPPDENERQAYDQSNIIDFSNTEDIKDIIAKQHKLKNAEYNILTTVDNVFVPNIGENDSPEMVGLKKAVIAKQIDLDKYEQRFGVNFNNDKRLFNKDSITLSKLKTMFTALDMKATLIIEDKDPSVPNPMGEPVIVDLMEGGENEDE